MSSYTMELRKVCDIYTREEVESWFSSYKLEDYLTDEQITTITSAGFWTKQKLAKKIVDFYFMREIGLETPYLFRHFAKIKMETIMERKLPLIYSKCLEFDPLVNVDFEEKFSKSTTGSNSNSQNASASESVTENKSSNGTSQSASTNSSSGLNIHSDTPQGEISKANILNGNYASDTNANENSATINDSTNTTSQNAGTLSRSNQSAITDSGSNQQSEMSTRTMKGNSGSITTAQHLIQQYRDIIVAVDEEIISELNSLFIGLF